MCPIKNKPLTFLKQTKRANVYKCEYCAIHYHVEFFENEFEGKNDIN